MAEVNGASPNSTQDLGKSTNAQIQTPPPSQPGTTSTSTADPAFPAISLNDAGLSRRPRDGRILHMILANMGVTAYQERVPQQLMDFAYRHTSSILQDALHFMSDVYNTSGTAGKQSSANDQNSVNLEALRLAVGSRTHYQFNPGLAKEQLQEMAHDRNRVALPPVALDGALRLPPERFILTGASFSLKDEWESEGEEDIPLGGDTVDHVMADHEEKEGDEEDERMEDFFGESFEGGNEDQEMEG
jgi:transcription initiation factor TFIID subunit 9B